MESAIARPKASAANATKANRPDVSVSQKACAYLRPVVRSRSTP